jgi:hypothetical protein
VSIKGSLIENLGVAVIGELGVRIQERSLNPRRPCSYDERFEPHEMNARALYMSAASSRLGKLTDVPAARNDVVRRIGQIGRIEDSTQFVIRIGVLPFAERGQAPLALRAA